MLWIPTRCNDLKFITNIEGYHGNIHKLGRLIRHNWFLVKDKSGGKGKERYCFLFKARLLICKVRRISEDRCVFVLKEIIKLPEVDFKNRSDKRTFEIHSFESNCGNFPYTFIAHEDDVKADWLREIQEHAEDDLTQVEHVTDDLKLQSQADEDLFEPLKGIELDISPDIEENLDPIERLGHKPLKHVPEPKRPPLEIPKKRTPIFTCVDPSPSPERAPTPEPEPEPDPDMFSSYHYEEVTVTEEVYVNAEEEIEEEEEELIEIPAGKRKPKYIPGVSKPLFHSTIRGSSNERTELFDEEYNWWRYTSSRSSDFLRKTEYESSMTAGENAVFECEVEGVNRMTWLKDNRPLSDRLADRISITQDNNVYKLEIKNITETDSGTYTARAENDCGVSFSTAHLIVEKLSDEEKKARAKATSPVFLVQLKDADLLESTHARFMVKVNGNPMPQVQFYKGDRLITSDDEHIEIVQDKVHPGFYEMVIPEVKPEDAGEYRCVASNKYSDETCSCIVTVTNEKDIFAGLDEEVIDGVPKFSWLKNGKPFSPEERFKVIYKDEEDSLALVFQNVKPEDAGLYTCVASTSHGKISCSAELTVQGTIKEIEKLPKKPKFENITTDFEGNVASTAVIEVKVSGDPLPKTKWFRNGEEIIESGRYKIIYDEETETASLVIKNLNLDDSGEYNVIAKNDVGTSSEFVNLHVKAPPRITKKLEDFTGLTGKELRLTIQVSASPKPIVNWYKDGMVIKKSNRVKYVTDEASDSYTLVIEDAVMEDAGTYSVVASNEYSQVSDVCHISMESPPQFVGTITKELETLEGDYVSFNIMVEGDPLPNVKWKYNGKEIVNDGKHFKMSSEGNVFTLLISEVKREDAGSYSCEISNQWGSNQCDGQLYVKCLPRFEWELKNLQVNDSDTDVEFTVKLNSFPKATVTWYHDETEITSKKKEYTCIEDGDTYKLIIKQATTKVSGNYTCKALNEIGYNETTATLSVYTFPVFKKELTDLEITEGETIKLTVSCTGIPEPDVKWYRNGEEIYSDSRVKISRDAKRVENYNLTITLVRSEDGGEYEVRASNERGTAVTKSLITVLASTDHKKRLTDGEAEAIIVNGDDKSESSEKLDDGSQNSKQVKESVTVKLPPKKKIIETKDAPKAGEKCDTTPTRKRLSTESGDEESFSVRELRSEELTAATELKASNFGLVEEPPENEHYIKINISRGVSIVSVSEEENMDDQTSTVVEGSSSHTCSKKSKSVFELNEEDELNLEINEDLKISTDNESKKNSFFARHSKINETVMNAINKRLSSLEGENDVNIVSYNSSRKSSVIEETAKPQRASIYEKEQLNFEELQDQKDNLSGRKSSLRSVNTEENLKKATKAVSFDEQPARICESDNTDDAVEELFKRIKTQRSILGEILEKQQSSNDETEKQKRKDSLLGRKLSAESVKDDTVDELKGLTTEQRRGSKTNAELVDFPDVDNDGDKKQASGKTDSSLDACYAKLAELKRLTSQNSVDEANKGTLGRRGSRLKGESIDASEGDSISSDVSPDARTAKSGELKRLASQSSVDEPKTATTGRRGSRLQANSVDVSETNEISIQKSYAVENGIAQKGTSAGTGERRSSFKQDSTDEPLKGTIRRRGSSLKADSIDVLEASDVDVKKRNTTETDGVPKPSTGIFGDDSRFSSQDATKESKAGTIERRSSGLKADSMDVLEASDTTIKKPDTAEADDLSKLSAGRIDERDVVDEPEKGTIRRRKSSLKADSVDVSEIKDINVKKANAIDSDVTPEKLSARMGERRRSSTKDIVDEPTKGTIGRRGSSSKADIEDVSEANEIEVSKSNAVDSDATPTLRERRRFSSQESANEPKRVLEEKRKENENRGSIDDLPVDKSDAKDVDSSPQSSSTKYEGLRQFSSQISFEEPQKVEIKSRRASLLKAEISEVSKADIVGTDDVPKPLSANAEKLKHLSSQSSVDEPKKLTVENRADTLLKGSVDASCADNADADKSSTQNTDTSPQSHSSKFDHLRRHSSETGTEEPKKLLKEERKDSKLKADSLEISEISNTDAEKSTPRDADMNAKSHLKRGEESESFSSQYSVEEPVEPKPSSRRGSKIRASFVEISEINDEPTTDKSKEEDVKVPEAAGIAKVVKTGTISSQNNIEPENSDLEHRKDSKLKAGLVEISEIREASTGKPKHHQLEDVDKPKSKDVGMMEKDDSLKHQMSVDEPKKTKAELRDERLKSSSSTVSDANDTSVNEAQSQNIDTLPRTLSKKGEESSRTPSQKTDMETGGPKNTTDGGASDSSVLKGDVYDAENANSKHSLENKRNTLKPQNLRSSTLDSVSDISFDDDKGPRSKRGSLVAGAIAEEKGEFPQVLSGMEKDIETFETLSASFEVQGFGVPRPSVTWFHNDSELKASKHFVMTEDGDKYKIQIVDLKACDGGVYTAKLTNCVGEASKEAKLLVSNVENLRGPKLRQSLKDTTVIKRQEAVLEATFIADPVPEAKWTIDEKDVNADFSVDVKELDLDLKECTYRMKIPSTELSDTGTYKVKVKNKFDSAESSASLTIVMKPEIEVFRDLVVPPTMPCTFEATVMSTPEAEVTWYVNGKKITKSSKYRIGFEKIDEYRTVHRLSIEDCELSDEGEYKIEAENNIGKSEATAALKLYTEKPSFLKLLEDCTVQDYDLLQMKVRVNGLPIPDIKWYRNGKEISLEDEHYKIVVSEEGQVSSTLTIEHFSIDDVAEYKVIAKNIVGEAQTTAKLTLAQIEPSFADSLKRVTEVSDGEPLDISTKVIGSPIPSVQWFKDGEPIKPDDDHTKTSVSPNGVIRLSIDKVDANDCGAYKAIATNDLGKSIANTAVVVTQPPKKPSFIKKLNDVDVVEGQPIKLEVQIDGFPEPTVKWLKDGHVLHPCPRMDFICGPNSTYGLTIDKATLQDIGPYSVIISNRCGEESNSSNVNVTPADKAPVFQTQLKPVKVVEGYPAKLEAKIDGFPLPKLTWYFNGNPLKVDNENIKLGTTPEGNHCLLIDKVTKDNAGDYELVAKNDKGDNSSKARLTVASRSNSEIEHEKPVFLNGLRDVSVDESGELSISAPFRGNPIPDVQWFKDGSLLLPNERIHFTCDGYKVGLEIQDVNMGDMGFYSCALKNPYGEDSSAAHVGVRKLYQAPIFTQRFRHIQQLPKHDAKFHCRVTGVPFPSVMWHRNGLPISNSDKYQIKRDGDVCCLTIFNVGHDDEATYSCIASNRDGTATCEAQLEIVDKIDTAPKQEAPQFLKKIGDCEIYAGMTAKFTACTSGYPEPEYEWFCDTIRLHPCDRIEMEKEGSGLVRLKIAAANPDMDAGRYRLRAFNPHGEAFCEANIIFDSGLESKHRRPVGELYKDYDRFRATGAPLPLADKPIICQMTDRHLTLSWKPSIPIGPREPVTYLVEMEEQPNGKWFTARAGIRSCVCDVHNLKPFIDYKFRVRVENKYGISDPSPFAITHREKLEPDPPKIRTHLPRGEHFHPDTAHYFPKDFDIERPPHDNYAQAPRFLRQEYDAQYGVKGHNVNLFWFVYGYPKPKISFYFNDELIEMGGRYDCSYTRNGQATLFVNKMMDRDVGVYEAVAVNEHGTARQRVQLKIAEYPEFLRRPEETYVPLRKTCKLEARVIGVPYPEIKWYKDWKPLANSSRIQIEKIEPDLCILRINEVIKKDEGLYSISARNIAGSISTSVYVHIEESDHETIVGGKKGDVLTRNKPFVDVYDMGDELGRGTQGIVFHAVERNTGKNLAAKVMHGTGDLRKWMTNELETMNHLKHRNIIRPYDSLITSKSFTIIEELASGGELLDVLTRKTFTSEYEISKYIRQLLSALDHMHDFNIAHLGLTPGDLLISHPGGDQLKLTDFGLSRRINSRKLEPLYFGMPEFVPPEVASGEGVNLSADMWSVGVITHLLLTGVSLFRGKDDVDTLDRIKQGQFSVNTDISADARDFIIKLLMMNPNNRMDVRAALNHKWIQMSSSINPPDDRQINTENLRNYYNLYKDWYCNSGCRTWFRRRPLDSAYNDPSRLVYPPGRAYSPAPTPEPPSIKEESKYKSWKDRIPSREPLDIGDIGVIKSESHYQYGPDTYLLQLRDVDFPCRLREYMKVAKRNTTESCDWQAPVIRERRKFMDVMDEEIDDERKARINQYGSADIYTLRRLKQEIGVRPTAHVEAEAILGSRIDGLPPFFREKPQILPVEIDKPAELVCYAVGSPKPLVQWFKNDLVISESQRIKIEEDNDGRSILRFNPTSDFDLGIYKVVARNKFGQTVARTRLVPASEPCPPEAPEIADYSDTEVLLKWKQLKDDGNSPVLCYGLQYQENDDGKWKTIAENIDHEAWLVHDLKPCIQYQFRLLAMNKIGWSTPGYPSQTVTTKISGAEKLIVPHVLRNMQIVCEKGKEIIGDEPRTMPDYSLEYKPLQWEEQPPEEKYRFISEISRGQFSIIVKAIDSSNGKVVVAKLMETNSAIETEINREFDILKTMRNERIAFLIEAFKLQFSSVAIFIMEKLQGADILTYLTNRHSYTEQMVATIITQILDGLQYLHWRGYCHLNLQPDNIVMASVRSLQVKLIDFSCAQHVNRLGTVVPNKGPLEYTAPEILCDEPAYSYSDIWSVGVLTYLLLSGISPFRGYTELETRQNITFVRYRFEHLYKNLSQEALRFIMLLFKRTPSKRPSAEDCHEHRWLLPSEYMIKKRERTNFDSLKLKSFSDDYHSKRNARATNSKEILSVIGGRVQRSNSIIEELEVLNT